jgi:hypothetical protein
MNARALLCRAVGPCLHPPRCLAALFRAPLATPFAALMLAACAGPTVPHPPIDLDAAYVVVGTGGQAIARAILAADACPDLQVDGSRLPMQTRAEPGIAPQRPHQAKASAFPVRVCEAAVPGGARVASIAGRALALPRAEPQRIVVLGDTGCRIKQSDSIYQDCSDSAAWPLRALSAAAAQEHPDLVVHVGDYHYRESACPAGLGCANSPWGYGWDAWNADLFDPAASLLAAAPWVVTRGNHELCARAGQGWFRLLDPAPLAAQRRCDVADLDSQADFSVPYAVPLGDHWQLIIFDSARASQPLDRSLPADEQAFVRYESDMDAVTALASVPGMHSIFVSHHPALGFSVDKHGKPRFGTPALLGPMLARVGPRYFPPGVDMAMHGHVHTFEAIDFRSDHPATLVTGHGGDNLDVETPMELTQSYASAPGVQIDFVAHSGRFGYLVLDRAGASWRIRAQGLDGTVQARCTLDHARLSCAQAGAMSRPAAEAH